MARAGWEQRVDAERGEGATPLRRTERARAGAGAIAGLVAISISVLIIVVVLAAMAFQRTPVRDRGANTTPGASEESDEPAETPSSPSDTPSPTVPGPDDQSPADDASAAPSPTGS